MFWFLLLLTQHLSIIKNCPVIRLNPGDVCCVRVTLSYGDVQQRFGLLLFDVVSVQRDVLDLPALSEQQVCSRSDGVDVRPRRRADRGRSHCLVDT